MGYKFLAKIEGVNKESCRKPCRKGGKEKHLSENKAFVLASYSVIAANKEDVITSLRSRHRWAGQNAWNRENMKTESCQFPAALDARLRRCCEEAGISRSQLIRFMLMEWMDAWEARKEENGR